MELMELNSELTKSLQMYHDLMREMPAYPKMASLPGIPPQGFPQQQGIPLSQIGQVPVSITKL